MWFGLFDFFQTIFDIVSCTYQVLSDLFLLKIVFVQLSQTWIKTLSSFWHLLVEESLFEFVGRCEVWRNWHKQVLNGLAFEHRRTKFFFNQQMTEILNVSLDQIVVWDQRVQWMIFGLMKVRVETKVIVGDFLEVFKSGEAVKDDGWSDFSGWIHEDR